MGIGLARLVVLVSGALLAVAGLLLILIPGFGASVIGIYMVVLGGAMVIGALVERMRYRAEALDRSAPPIGPGGGEPMDATLEPRFTRTDEVFVDPTSGHRMRVFTDPRTGERRYRAES